ncbi:hypothetical protein [Polaribacter gangjinensis]|uniref:Uncharacterized protein n=1 Tax=Polaribacter gangjinensis TaxID=574710 RepID=A0A2S7W8A9_9FLAO|nr:hypothetical protein [Polaribacter gangjinensis]PQJ73864.1 hypothetical protein BTO13_00590 [Polaribacter gangjinensis]
MKNILTSIIIIISIHSFSQNELKNGFVDIFQTAKVEENHFFVQDVIQKLNLQLFEEIKISEDLKKYPIAEKKFVFKEKTSSDFKITFQKNLIEENKIDSKQSFIIEMNENFIDNVIVKLLIEEDKIQEIIVSDIKNIGDRNLEIYRNLSDLENKLLIVYKIDNSNSIQIGNDIFPHVYKLQKTDVEKTLNTSLNLLAVNF